MLRAMNDARFGSTARLCAIVAVLGLGCGTSHSGGDASADGGGTSDFAGAYVMDTCGPADGPALQVILFDAAVPECSADTDRRSLSFYVYGARFPITAGTTVTSSSASATGGASFCLGGASPCQTSSDFTITFDTFVDGASASGSYSISWTDGSTDAGTFGAEWCMSGPILCG
jgi:hypothetical protein